MLCHYQYWQYATQTVRCYLLDHAYRWSVPASTSSDNSPRHRQPVTMAIALTQHQPAPETFHSSLSDICVINKRAKIPYDSYHSPMFAADSGCLGHHLRQKKFKESPSDPQGDTRRICQLEEFPVSRKLRHSPRQNMTKQRSLTLSDQLVEI